MKWQRLRRHARDGYLTLCDTFYRRITHVRTCKKGGVLLVRLDGIGDFFLWLASARILRRTYIDAHITLVAEKAFSAFASQLPYFDEVISVDRRRLAHDLTYRYDMFDRIRDRRYEAAILPAYNRAWRFRDAEAVIRMARAERKVGSAGVNAASWQDKTSRRWYTELVPATPHTLHELDRNAEFLRGIGIDDPSASIPLDPFSTSPIENGKAALNGHPASNGRAESNGHVDAGGRAGSNGHVDCGGRAEGNVRRGNGRSHLMPRREAFASPIPTDRPYFVLIPGAGSATRRWPADRFARIAERITRETGWHGVLCGGGPSDLAIAREIHASATVPLIDYTGKTSLADLLEIIRHAGIVIGNETGALHMAAAIGTPGVSITGGGHFARFVPYSSKRVGPAAASHPMPCYHCDWRCVYPLRAGEPAPCITGISVDAVWEKVELVLRKDAERYDPMPTGIQ